MTTAGRFETITQEFRFSLRSLRRRWTFAALAVGSLAIGIGSFVAAYAVVDATDLRPLPYVKPDRLVALLRVTSARSLCSSCLKAPSQATFASWRSSLRSYGDLAAHRGVRMSVAFGEDREAIWVATASSNLASILGVQPVVGRFFSKDEEAPGANHVIVLASHYWHQRFAGDMSVIGKTIAIAEGGAEPGTQPYTVIGIMPEDFAIPPGMDGWIPLNTAASGPDASDAVAVLGRLAKGATLQQARIELAAWAQTARVAAGTTDSSDATVVSLRESLIEYHAHLGSGRFVLLIVVGGLLLLTVSNLAALMVAQYGTRERDLAIRAALGAARPRLLLQPAFEVAMLVIGGTLFGVSGARALLPVVAAQLGATAAGLRVAIDTRVVIAAVALTLGCGLSLMLILWRQITRLRLGGAMRVGRSSGDAKQLQTQAVVLGVEVAAAFLVVATADMLLRDFRWMRNNAPGYDPSGLVYVQTRMPPSNLAKSMVQQVEAGLGTPLVAVQTDDARETEYRLSNGDPPLSRADVPFRQIVSARFFATLAIPVVSGRAFRPEDRLGAPSVAVINRAAATRLWPGSEAIGQQLIVTDAERHVDKVSVVGVVENTRLFTVLGGAGLPIIYRLMEQVPARPRVLFIRTSAPLPQAVERLQNSTQGLFPSALRRTDVKLMSDYLDRETKVNRFNASAVSAIAVIVLVLAALGVYGLATHTVATRTREIATRTALGAQPLDIVRLVMNRTLVIAALGMIFGIATFWMSQRIVRSLFDLSAPITHFGPTTGTIAIGLAVVVSTLVPLRRALVVDPIVVLRGD